MIFFHQFSKKMGPLHAPSNAIMIQWRQKSYPLITWDTGLIHIKCTKLQPDEIAAATVLWQYKWAQDRR